MNDSSYRRRTFHILKDDVPAVKDIGTDSEFKSLGTIDIAVGRDAEAGLPTWPFTIDVHAAIHPAIDTKGKKVEGVSGPYENRRVPG